MKYNKDMDKECIKICNAINKLHGIRTTESCCGHGDTSFRIWFDVDDPEELPILLFFCDPCHVGFTWDCLVTTDCGMSPVTFHLESESIGETAYKEAAIIAKAVTWYLDNKSMEDIIKMINEERTI